MRHDVRQFRAVPSELVPDALASWTARTTSRLETRTAVEAPSTRPRRHCQMMMVVDQLALR